MLFTKKTLKIELYLKNEIMTCFFFEEKRKNPALLKYLFRYAYADTTLTKTSTLVLGTELVNYLITLSLFPLFMPK